MKNRDEKLDLIEVLLESTKPKTIIELGAGDSTKRIVEYVMKDKERVLHTVDNAVEVIEGLERWCSEQYDSHSDQIIFYAWDEITFAQSWRGDIDFLLLDGAESTYREVFEIFRGHLTPGSIVLAHDVEHITEAIKFKNYMLLQKEFGCIVMKAECGMLVAQKYPEAVRGNRRPEAASVIGV